LKLHVYGQRREKPDVRRVARAILRLAVELDAESAGALAETLEHEEALQRKALLRARRAEREDQQ
jgi:hypothetical protein